METIYYNGDILTMEDGPAPEALYVRDGVIKKLGTRKELEKLAPEADTFDLRGMCLMPAFVDAHSHIVMNGQLAAGVDLSGCTSFDDIVFCLKSYLKNHQDAEAVFGFGYDHNFLAEEQHPTRFVLDKASRDVPILILHTSAHMACMNTKLMENAGITADMQNPEGGRIGRNADGTPNGYLEENALQLVFAVAGKSLVQDIAQLADNMQKNYLKYGITTVQEGAADAGSVRLLRHLADAGLLKVDVVAYPVMTQQAGKLWEENPELTTGQYHNHLRLGGYKLVLDGSPQGRSAWLSKPYLGADGNECGYPRMSSKQVEQCLRQAVLEKRQVLAHCNGDAASEQYLDAYEKVVKDTGSKDELRPVMIHCQTVRRDQLERMAKIKMIASIFVGHVYYWGDVHRRNLGMERGDYISPVRDAIDMGLHVNFHQDTPVTKPDMFHSIWCAVNRISRKGEVIGAGQQVSVGEALRAVTIEAAYEYFEENRKGSLREGKQADMIIVDRNPLTCNPAGLKDIRVLHTIKDGQKVYSLEAE